MEMDPAKQQVTDTDTPGLIARPPLLFLGALLLGFISGRLLPLPFPVPVLQAYPEWTFKGR